MTRRTRELGSIRHKLNLRPVAILGATAILSYLVLGPLAMLLGSSFRDAGNRLPTSDGVPWSLQNYREVLGNPGTGGLLVNTLVFSVGALAVGFAISVALAWLTERTDMPLRNAVFIMVVASIGIPNIIMGVAWELIGSPINGLVNLFLRQIFGSQGPGPLSIYTMPGLVFVQGISLVPMTYLLVTAAFRAMDPGLEEAASIAGARFRTIARRISLPLLTPALASALVYQFVTVIESFDIPLIIGLRAGIPVLSTQIFVEARPRYGLPDYGLASAYSALLILFVLVPLIGYSRILKRSERYATITGRAFRPRRMGLGKWRYPAITGCLAFAGLAFVAPTCVLVWTSLLPYYSVPSIEALSRVSLAAYGEVLGSSDFLRILVNTIAVGGCAALGTMVLSTLVAWIVIRTRSAFRFVLDGLAFMPHIMPGVIIGISILLIYLVLPNPLLDTIWIIVLALVTQFVSIATRLMTGNIAQIKVELEEAGSVSGAGFGNVMRRIVLPLMWPAFVNGLLLVFVLCIKNLTQPLILMSPSNGTLSTLVYRYWAQGNVAETSVVGVVLLVITLTLSVLLRLRENRGAVMQ